MRYLHTMVRVRSLDESLDFYCRKLGLEEVRRIDNKGGRYTLVFLAAPGDRERAEAERAPLLELTYNWDNEGLGSARNFGHIAFEVDDIYAFCQRLGDAGLNNQQAASRWTHGLCQLTRQHLYRNPAEGRCAPAARAMVINGQYRDMVMFGRSPRRVIFV